MAKPFQLWEFLLNFTNSQRLLWLNIAVVLLLPVGLFAQVATGSDNRLLSLVFFLLNLAFWIVLIRSASKREIKGIFVVPLFLITLIAVASFPPATSKDVNSYALYGRMVSTYEVSPYTHTPRDFPTDPWFERVSYFWSDSPSVYGPVFTGLSAGVTKIAGDSFTLNRIGFQLLAALGLVVAVAAASRAIGWVMSTALIGLNPLILTFGVNDGHCDVLIGTAVVTGAVLLMRKHVVWAGVALAVAALIKIAAIPALGGALIWAWFKLSKKASVRLALSSALTLLIGLVVGGGLKVLEPLSQATGRHTRFSLWNPAHNLLDGFFVAAPPTHSTPDQIVSIAASIAVLVIGLWLIYRHRVDSVPFLAIAAGLVVYQLFGAYVLSWYAIWAIPVLALVWRSPLALISMFHGSWIAIAYFSGYGALVVLAAVIAWFVFRVVISSSPFPWMKDKDADGSILAVP